jgi:D-arginine dehydrogenase
MKRSPEKPNALIIGGGLAGAATAYHLGATGRWRVTVFEAEKTPGRHASGRNAAMIRQAVTPAPVAELARRGAAKLAELSARADLTIHATFRKSGSILWGRPSDLEPVAACAPADTRPIDRDEISAKFKGFPLPPDGSGLWTPSDGLLDVAAWNHFFLTASPNVTVKTAAEVESGRILFDGRFSVRAAGVETIGDVVVNAAGAWADRVAGRFGIAGLGLLPKRRHLFHSGALSWVDPLWPFFWDVSEGLYFRPESNGLLLSACDEDVSEPKDAEADPRVVDLLAQKLAKFGGAAADLPIAKSWAGLRTFFDDHSFVIGPDRRNERFFWVAGLGGHGVTTSFAVGELAAAIIDGRSAAPAYFSPAR